MFESSTADHSLFLTRTCTSHYVPCSSVVLTSTLYTAKQQSSSIPRSDIQVNISGINGDRRNTNGNGITREHPPTISEL